MSFRRSLSLSILLAVVAAPSIVGCAAESSPEGAEADGDAQSAPLTKDLAAVDAVSEGTRAPSPIVRPGVGTITNDLTPAVVEALPIDPNAPGVQQTSAGDGWRVMHVAGTLPDAKTGAMTAVDDDIIILESKEAIDLAPLGAKTRAELKATSTLRASKTLAAASPVLAKGLVGTSPAAEESLFTVVHKKSMDQMENPTPPPPGVTYFSFCDDYDGEYTKTLSVDKSYAYHKGDETGSFTGAFDVNARMQGNATATIKYRAKTSIAAACHAVWIDFKKAQVTGTADLTASGKVDAQFHKEWHYSKTIAEPTVFNQWFTIGVVPVHLLVKVPVEAGVDADAKATLHANAKVIGHGAFDVSCTSSSCTGSKSASIAIDSSDPPSFEATARVKVTPWAQASLKAVLFDETIGGYGQVGIRASLPTDLYAYAGNMCGDGDGNGQNESVTGLTLDMAVKVDIVAKAGAFGGTIGPWTWNVANKHLLFKSFGEGSILDPVFTYEKVPGQLLHTRMHGKMRPCWPYADAITYRITWSDGSISSFTGAPSTLFTQDHDFATYGIKPIKLEAIRDAAGRDLAAAGSASMRNVYLKPFDDVFTPVGGGLLLAQ
ncbi:MAG: hypothetical protein JWP87_2689 [Labilithrix sp.]|nr:hypothetical protein [Labilithrix sp.]